MKKKKKKSVEKICKNCKLYNPVDKVCGVTVLIHGEKYELPTLPQNKCFWEKEGIEIEELKMWSDGKNGYVSDTAPNRDLNYWFQ